MTDRHSNGPTWVKKCRCGATVERWRGDVSVVCVGCGAGYNAAGQELRPHYEENASSWDEDVSDMDGHESALARAEQEAFYD